MTETGKAAFLVGPRQPHEIRDVPLPEVEPDGILVRVTAAGVCGSDLHIWRGELPQSISSGGRVPGHEMAGRVARLGSNIRTDSLGQPLKEGDPVVYAYFYPCQRCYTCLKGQLYACPNKYGKPAASKVSTPLNGAYAEYYYLRPGHFVFKVPDDLSDEVVAPVNCALSQVIFGLSKAGVRFGDTVLVQGAGGLGLNATAVAKDMGADRVIVIDGVKQRLELARQFGADETIDLNDYPTPEARVGRVRDLTSGRGADVVAELVGLPQAVPEGLSMTRVGGTYLEIGNISAGATTTIEPSSMLTFSARTVVGVITYDPWTLPVALDFLVRTRGKYPIGKVVSHKFPLDKIDDAFQQAEWLNRQGDQTRVTRAVITP